MESQKMLRMHQEIIQELKAEQRLKGDHVDRLLNHLKDLTGFYLEVNINQLHVVHR